MIKWEITPILFKNKEEFTLSGHSKWNNIKRKKEKTDAQRAKIFTKIGRELTVAVRDGGGGDPNTNSRLKDCIAKAKANNVPNENIERIIKKAAGSSDGANYESIVYEGYGLSGVAFIVETLTDNRNRTAGNIRHYFDKYGGNLGTTGCVSFMFSKKGVIVIEKTPNKPEEIAVEDALEVGASDFNIQDDCFVIITDPEDYSEAHASLSEKGYHFVSSEIEMVPENYIEVLDSVSLSRLQNFLEILEDDDDVQNVWHNCENLD